MRNEKQSNGLGIGSLVCGILSVVTFWLWGIPGIILGSTAIGLGAAQRVRGDDTGMGTGGMITGIIGFVLGAAMLGCGVVLIASGAV